MPIPLKRPGYTLMEVVTATALVGFAIAALLSLLVMSQRVRVSAESRGQAALAAHQRCVLFADKLIYPEALTLTAPSTVIRQPGDLPGGVPVTEVIETITPAADGASATLSCTYVVGTARTQDARVTAFGVRMR